MKNTLIAGIALSTTVLTPIAASAATEVQFWHAFTGRLGELVAAQVDEIGGDLVDHAGHDVERGHRLRIRVVAGAARVSTSARGAAHTRSIVSCGAGTGG